VRQACPHQIVHTAEGIINGNPSQMGQILVQSPSRCPRKSLGPSSLVFPKPLMYYYGPRAHDISRQRLSITPIPAGPRPGSCDTIGPGSHTPIALFPGRTNSAQPGVAKTAPAQQDFRHSANGPRRRYLSAGVGILCRLRVQVSVRLKARRCRCSAGAE